MIGRRAVAGLSLLCALMFSAFAAQSAVAQKGTKAVNTTAVTCVKGGGNLDFKDAHCDEFVGAEKGEYGHVAIANDTTTEIELSQEGSAIFNIIWGGANQEIVCQKAASIVGKSFLHNVLTETNKHTVTGTVQLNFTECKVEKPANCTIKSILTTFTTEGVEGLGPNKNEMGIEFVGEGEGGTFAEINYEGEKCSLLNGGKAFLTKGTILATGKAATQKEKHSGATWKFETGSETNTMETIELALKPQRITGVFTIRMAGGGNPISLTTVT